jgi:hypothetical protein
MAGYPPGDLMGDFQERIAELQAMTVGDLVGKVEVDQVYAKYQHERLDLKHPRGGRAKYLSGPLMENAPGYLQSVADGVLEDGGVEAMTGSMQLLSNEVFLNAPVELNDLRNSGHPSVTSDGVVVHDEAPNVTRLTEAQLRAKGRLRRLLGAE